MSWRQPYPFLVVAVGSEHLNIRHFGSGHAALAHLPSSHPHRCRRRVRHQPGDLSAGVGLLDSHLCPRTGMDSIKDGILYIRMTPEPPHGDPDLTTELVPRQGRQLARIGIEVLPAAISMAVAWGTWTDCFPSRRTQNRRPTGWRMSSIR